MFESDVLYFVVDSGDNVFFVLVHDNVNNGEGGHVNLIIDSPDIGGRGVEVLLRDDYFPFTSSCVGYPANGLDCYAWNSTLGSGSFAWTWVSGMHTLITYR